MDLMNEGQPPQEFKLPSPRTFNVRYLKRVGSAHDAVIVQETIVEAHSMQYTGEAIEFSVVVIDPNMGRPVQQIRRLIKDWLEVEEVMPQIITPSRLVN